MVITPNIIDLPSKVSNGIRYFELVAEPVTQEILPGVYINGWGYNGSIPGPTIKAYSGETVVIRLINKLPEPTSVHWHGLDVPNNMDGVPAVEPTPQIDPEHYFDYQFTISNPAGTHMYHTHVNSAKQQMMGLSGAFIVLDPNGIDRANKDYFLMLEEFKLKGLEMGEVKPGVYELDTMSESFNFFTINGKCFPATTPLPVKYGDLVRIRLGAVMHHAHPMHIHGHQFVVTAIDGNDVPTASLMKRNTVNVASGETYDVEFIADNEGIWPFHCHIPHHMTNNMGKELGGMTTTIVYQ